MSVSLLRSVLLGLVLVAGAPACKDEGLVGEGSACPESCRSQGRCVAGVCIPQHEGAAGDDSDDDEDSLPDDHEDAHVDDHEDAHVDDHEDAHVDDPPDADADAAIDADVDDFMDASEDEEDHHEEEPDDDSTEP